MRTALLLLMIGSASIVFGLEDKAVTDFDKKEMDAAMAKAKSKIDDFIKVMKSGEATNFSVKIGVSDNGKTEYFWLAPVKFTEKGEFVGKINNDPDMVKNVKIGQEMRVPKGDVVDWIYMKGKVMYGNYTLRVLMKTMKKDEREEMNRLFELSKE